MQPINILWIFVVAAAALGAVAAWILYRKRSSQRLLDRFGPEYRVAVEKLGNQSKGEAELKAREQRVQRLELTTLTPADAARFSESWATLQGRFVDDPKGVVAGADELVRRLILRRGYPIGDFEHLAADISVDHPEIVQHYRAARAAAMLCVLALSGCVAIKYQMAQKGMPPPTLLLIADSAPPIDVDLRSVIIDGGPGSWKRRALWDEYVVTIRNQGEEPLTIAVAMLSDFSGKPLSPGTDPWALEKASQSLEQRYKRAGVAFARTAAPRAAVFGAAVAGAAIGGAAETATVAAAGASVIALPVVYVVVWHKNRLNKAAISTEFARRRLAFPLTLAAGEMRTGSIFFPMAPDPRSLMLGWTSEPSRGGIDISLDSLVGIHTPAQRCVSAGKAGSTPCAATVDTLPQAKGDDSPEKEAMRL